VDRALAHVRRRKRSVNGSESRNVVSAPAGVAALSYRGVD
jgi:hypothetical protein